MSGALSSSVLLLGGRVRDTGAGVRGMVGELLSRIEWEAIATDDALW